MSVGMGLWRIPMRGCGQRMPSTGFWDLALVEERLGDTTAVLLIPCCLARPTSRQEGLGQTIPQCDACTQVDGGAAGGWAVLGAGLERWRGGWAKRDVLCGS